LPFDDGLEKGNDQPGGYRNQHSRQAGSRPGGLGCNKHSARGHGRSTIRGLSMSTSKV
jgi:hypothetical protein